MPKVLGMELVSNAEVLNFIKDKKREYELQEGQDVDKKQKRSPKPKPNVLLYTLEQHQEHLESDHYPYEKNPSVYGSARMIKVEPNKRSNTTQALADTSDMAAERKFNELFAERIVLPSAKAKLAATKQRLGRALTAAEKDTIVNEVDAQHFLSESERLMVLNHAPTCLEMLQPMIENIEARYSDEEQAFIVEAIQEAFRPDELANAAIANGNEDGAMEVDA